MKVDRNRNFILTLDKDRLSVIDIITLSRFHQQRYPTASTMTCSEEHVFIGTTSGSLLALNLFDLGETCICRMGSPITTLFYLDEFVYCGSEDGLINVYGKVNGEESTEDMADTFPSSFECDSVKGPFSEGESGAFRIIRSMKHPVPVTQICTDGVEMFVADMRNRITVYPSKKTYDMRNPCLKYKNYVFASERNMLYCRTRTAFAVYISLRSPVHDYKFSENGGIVFVQCGNVVNVIDFNERCMLREVKVDGEFVYDDDRNRIIKLDSDITAIDNVLEGRYREMDNVKFREDNVVEKKKKVIEELDDDVVSRYVDCGSKREAQRKYFKGVGKTVSSGRSIGDSPTRCEKGVIESSDEEDAEAAVPLRDTRVLRFNSSALDTEEGMLLSYNLEGYMMSLRGEDRNKVEVSYHDVNRRRVEIVDANNCTLGSFRGANVVLGNRSKIFFTSPEFTWEKDVEARILCVTEEMVVAVSSSLRVFKLDGIEMFNCLIPDIHTVCCSGSTIAVFSRELILIDLFRSTERVFLPSPVSFACFDENGRIFYRIGDEMYHLYKGLSVKVCDVPTHPLAVFGNSVVSLTQSCKLLPQLHIQHIKFSNDVIKFVLSDQSDIHEGFVDECTVLDVNKENVTDAVPIVQHTKRYNPFNKQ